MGSRFSFPGFVYAGARLIEARKTIEIEVRPRTGAKAHCSGCGQPLPRAPGFLAPQRAPAREKMPYPVP